MTLKNLSNSTTFLQFLQHEKQTHKETSPQMLIEALESVTGHVHVVDHSRRTYFSFSLST